MYVRDGISYPTYGAYLRGKNLRTDTKATERHAWDREIDAFKEARRQGIMPAGSRMPQIQEAVRKSEEAGKGFNAATGGFFD